jgi:hypothetical protein
MVRSPAPFQRDPRRAPTGGGEVSRGLGAAASPQLFAAVFLPIRNRAARVRRPRPGKSHRGGQGGQREAVKLFPSAAHGQFSFADGTSWAAEDGPSSAQGRAGAGDGGSRRDHGRSLRRSFVFGRGVFVFLRLSDSGRGEERTKDQCSIKDQGPISNDHSRASRSVIEALGLIGHWWLVIPP